MRMNLNRKVGFRPVLRQVHLYIGVVLSLVLVVLALTGSALVLKERYWRAVYPELRGPAPELSWADHARAVARAEQRYGASVSSVKLPEPGVNAYHLYLTDGEAFLAVTDQRVIDEWGPLDRPMSVMFDLHAHLMAGEAGEKVGGVIGLLGGLLVVTGLVLWWPARRRFSVSTLLPRDLKRRTLIMGHRDLGALTSPVLLVLLLTGSGLVFYGTARSLLNGVFGDPVPTDPGPVATAGSMGAGPGLSLPRLFERASEEMPDARLVFYYPAGGTGVHGFRLKQPCELHPNGRSFVYMDGAGEVLDMVDACEAAPGERATHAIYPIHSAKVDSRLYEALTFLGGLVLALVSATGTVAYIRKLTGSKPPRTRGRGERSAPAGTYPSRGKRRSAEPSSASQRG